MAEVLELSHLFEKHGMTKMNIGAVGSKPALTLSGAVPGLIGAFKLFL